MSEQAPGAAQGSEPMRDPHEQIERLPWPLTFVHLEADLWQDIATADPPPLPAEVHQRFRTGEDAWILITYLALKHRGHEVRLSSRFLRDELCITHYNQIRWRSFGCANGSSAIRISTPDAM